jgi:hypothetical protein
MKIKYNLLALIIFLTSCQSKSQNRIFINIPSAKTEAEYIWRTIQDIKFFEEHNYQVSLPEGELIEQLKEKSESANLNSTDYEKLEMFVRDSIYNEKEYQKGHNKIQNELELINNMINQIDVSNFKWDFKEFESYQVNLTLYGPGGSYNPNEGTILIYTTPNGQFKNYENPANTIIHEVVHIGIEESIISKYNVPHSLKERIVDTFVSLNFGQYLPEYKIQDMGDLRLDSFIKKESDLNDLGEIVEQILKGK